MVTAPCPGVSHADDLGYIWHTYSTPEITPGSLEDKYLRVFIELWTNFAKFGDPTPANSNLGVRWTFLEQGKDLKVLDIGKPLQLINPPEQRRIELWLDVVSKATPIIRS